MPALVKTDKQQARQMKRFANILLLLCFALLQGIAPLAHAHINGSDSGKGVHLPELELTSAHDAGNIGHARDVVETQDSGVMQDNASLDEYIAAHVLATGFMWQSMKIIAVRHYHLSAPPLTSPSTSTHRPYPQAPPASAIL
jgi:hypothetical protein